MIDSLTIRDYCIKNNLFTCGSNSQYGKMFDYNYKFTHRFRDIAVIIWICSKTDKSIEDIEQDLKNLEAEYGK